jgi:hypothetical protein
MPKRRSMRVVEAEMHDAVRRVAETGHVTTEVADKREKWFYEYLSTGDARTSAETAGFTTQWLSWTGHNLIRMFSALIVEAVLVRRAGIEPLALQVHEELMRASCMTPFTHRVHDPELNQWRDEVLLDKEGNPVMVMDSRAAGVKLKAAISILNRGIMPEGLALHGLSPNPQTPAGNGDWKHKLDETVEQFGGGSDGAAMVLKIPLIGGHKEYRDYLLERYPQPKQLNAPAEAQPEGRPS